VTLTAADAAKIDAVASRLSARTRLRNGLGFWRVQLGQPTDDERATLAQAADAMHRFADQMPAADHYPDELPPRTPGPIARAMRTTPGEVVDLTRNVHAAAAEALARLFDFLAFVIVAPQPIAPWELPSGSRTGDGHTGRPVGGHVSALVAAPGAPSLAVITTA